MKEPPLVSIISGYYNRENYVEDSVKSLLAQTYSNIEIIIFDDCSTDSTFEKLKKMALSDKRLSVYSHENNKGFVQGLINAIKKAKGEYIAIHGSGDISHPSRIFEQMKIMQEYDNVGVVGCSVENIGKKFGVAADSSWIFNEKMCHENGKYRLLSYNYFTHGEVLIRKSYYDQVGGYRRQFKYSQDLDLWCRMSMVCDFYIVDKVLYKRFLLSDGVSANFQKAIVQQMLGDFALQCHAKGLKGEKDYIDKYGDQGLMFFTYRKRFFKKVFYKILKAKSLEEDSAKLKDTARFLIRQSFNIYTLSIYILVVVVSRSTLLALVSFYRGVKQNIFKR